MPAPRPDPRSWVPAQLTHLVGREREVAAVAELLLRDDVPVLTLTGPGGVGKTRLALQVASEMAEAFPDGVRFVGLAPVADHGLVASAIAHALGVREAGEVPLTARLEAHLREKRLLLVLDNVGQVVAAAPLVAGQPSACPRPTSRVASQMRLGEPGAHVDGSLRAAVSLSC